jgi:hypothetical protein
LLGVWRTSAETTTSAGISGGRNATGARSSRAAISTGRHAPSCIVEANIRIRVASFRT